MERCQKLRLIPAKWKDLFRYCWLLPATQEKESADSKVKHGTWSATTKKSTKKKGGKQSLFLEIWKSAEGVYSHARKWKCAVNPAK